MAGGKQMDALPSGGGRQAAGLISTKFLDSRLRPHGDGSEASLRTTANATRGRHHEAGRSYIAKGITTERHELDSKAVEELRKTAYQVKNPASQTGSQKEVE